MNRRSTIVNQNAFACSPSAQMPFSRDISSIRIFCKDIHETLKYVDKKNDEIQKEHTSLSPPSLLVDMSMLFDFPERMCMCQSLSLSL